MEDRRDSVIFSINGHTHFARGIDATKTLARYLRENANLTGTKVVCEEGDCGACTTLVSRNHESYEAVNSCILPLYAIDCAEIVTIEGIGNRERPHPVQSAFVEKFGSQCGYCTPGMVLATVGYIESCKRDSKQPDKKKLKNHLTGNLCRCTGYEQILEAGLSVQVNDVTEIRNQFPIQGFPPEVESAKTKEVEIQMGNGTSIHAPITLKAAFELKEKNPNLRIVSGSTDLQVVLNKHPSTQACSILSLHLINELKAIQVKGTEIEIGANVSIDTFERFLERQYSGHKVLDEIRRSLHIFASPQIKRQGKVLGNLLNASPIGDLIPVLMIAGAEIRCESSNGSRTIALDQFYLGYRKVDLRSDEIATAVVVPVLDPNDLQNLEIMKFYKVSVRKDLDISTVSMAFLKRGNQYRIALGGIAATVSLQTWLQDFLINQRPDIHSNSWIQSLDDLILKNLNPLTDVRADGDTRKLMIRNLVIKALSNG